MKNTRNTFPGCFDSRIPRKVKTELASRDRVSWFPNPHHRRMTPTRCRLTVGEEIARWYVGYWKGSWLRDNMYITPCGFDLYFALELSNHLNVVRNPAQYAFSIYFNETTTACFYTKYLFLDISSTSLNKVPLPRCGAGINSPATG